MRRRLFPIASLFFLAVVPLTTRAQVYSYCASNAGQTVVYFTRIFDTKLQPQGTVDTNPIAREFNEYLIGRFDIKSNENMSGGCPVGTTADMEASKRTLENQIRQGNRQVVGVEWIYTPNPVEIARHLKPHDMNVPPGPPPTHTFCLSDAYQGNFYATGPFEAGGNMTWGKWYSAFNQMLIDKYSFKGNAKCYVATLDDAHRLMNARSEGARVSGRKIVDTGWKYDPGATAVAKPAPRDKDPEPERPRPAPTATQQARDAAVKEMPEVKAFCQKDPLMSVVFNCELFVRSVYNYRTTNPGQTESIASLLSTEKLNAADAVDSAHVSIWISQRGFAEKLDNRIINCITQNVIVTLYKKPWPSRLVQFYKDALATCRRSP